MKFTGLSDKYGNDIYENNEVQLVCAWGVVGGIVEYDKGVFCVREPDGDRLYFTDHPYGWEIIKGAENG